MAYRLGVDVGGTFTDLLLFEERSGAFWRHKTPSTPADSSIGILTGVEAVCEKAGVTPDRIGIILHGTTVATNAMLEGKGARVGLITTEGYRDIMQIARSFVPGGLAGWIIWPKPEPLARLEDTIAVGGRMDAQGQEVRPLGEAGARAAIAVLRDRGVEAITVSFVTWGGGWGDPLARDPALVAKEVGQGLVTVAGARGYGVTIVDGAVDGPATEALRGDMRAARPATLALFDHGPDIETLRANCAAETGLPPPRQPVWTYASAAQ